MNIKCDFWIVIAGIAAIVVIGLAGHQRDEELNYAVAHRGFVMGFLAAKNGETLRASEPEFCKQSHHGTNCGFQLLPEK